MSDATMGQLRSVLHSPSQENFEAVLDLLESWPEEDSFRQQALPYAHSTLQSWPEEVDRGLKHSDRRVAALEAKEEDEEKARRRASLLCLADKIMMGWTYHRSGGHWPASMVEGPPFLARELQLSRSVSQGAVGWLAQQRFLDLRTLSLGYVAMEDQEVIEGLAAADWWETLEHLSLQIPDEVIAQVMRQVSLPNLHSLSPGVEGSCQSDGLRALLDAIGPGHLLTVDCQGAWLGEEAAEVLATHPAMASVLHLDMRYNAWIGSAGAQMLLNSEVLMDEAKRSVNRHYDDIFE